MFCRVIDGIYRIIRFSGQICCRKRAHFIVQNRIVVTVLVAFLLDTLNATAVVFYQVDFIFYK